MKKSIQIFKPGRHVATNGKVIEFTEAQLRAAAEAYDPKLHEAPLVIGHPKTDDPAYGWAKSLSYGDGLEAEPDQVEPAFAELVNTGRFKKISASFYEPDSARNPKPGVYYLRHIGFLGAHPPAVKGLKNASFADGDEGVLEFGDWTDSQQASMWRRLRDWFIGQHGLEEADKVIPDYAVANLEDAARAPSTSLANPAFAEPPKETTSMILTPEQIKALQDQNAELQAQLAAATAKTANFSEREAALKAAEDKTRRAGIKEFVTGLVTAGKILPRDEAGLIEYMASDTGADVIEFGEGDAHAKKPRGEWLREFLTALPVTVDYAERAAAEDRTGKKTPRVNAPSGYSVDPARAELHAKALDYAEKNKCDYVTAVSAVSH